MTNINIQDYDFYYKIRKQYFVQEIWLFGSRAKNKSKDGSDVDLAIVCENATDEEWRRILDIVNESDTLLQIDCIRFDKLDDDIFKQEIEKHKVVLFKRVPNNFEWYETFLDLGEALNKFNNVIKYDRRNFIYTREATIQIFEYCFELYWKLLKKICADEGVDTNSPRNTLQQSYVLGLITNETSWINMMNDRNLTSHTYRQPTASSIYENCKIYVTVMSDDYRNIQNRFKL